MIAFILNLLVLSLTWLSFSPAWQAWRSWADLALGLSFCFQTLSLGMETLKVGHLPLHNLYGSVLFLSCLCAWFLTFYGFCKGPYKTMVTCFRGQGGPAQTTSEQRVSRRFGSWRETLVFARFSSLLLPKSSPSWKVQTSGINASFTGNLRQSVFPTCQGWTLETKQACQTQTYRATACIVSPLMALCHLFCFYLPTDLKKPQPLIPALQSHWLEMHVVSMLASYCLLFCGGLFAFAFLFYTWQPGRKRLEQNAPKFTRSTGEALNLLSSDLHALHRPDGPVPGTPADGPLPGAPADGPLPGAPADGLRPAPSLDGLHAAQKPQTHFESLNWLDLASYRTIGLGFAFLTCGLISGAVWANETWSTFWSWDVKETWALITWLIFAMYLHTRLFQGWHGKKSAWFAGLGFVSVWITYLGVNLLSKGLHSYGFLFPS